MRSDMRIGRSFAQHIDLIRQGAGLVAHRPFAQHSMVEACLWAERAGMPAGYRLPDTAREYAVISDRERLTTRLASRLGDPSIPPMPPLWPLLSLVLLGWRETISQERVFREASRLGAKEEVGRGLAIVAYLFPELEGWRAGVPLRVPRWERTFAVPFAARKLVLPEHPEPASSATPADANSTGLKKPAAASWRVTGGSRRGASHVHADLPNQDAIRYWASEDNATAALALADGHGSDLYFRSETGSRLAAETAVATLRRYAGLRTAQECRSTKGRLALELTAGWRDAVACDLKQHPITAQESKSLVATAGWSGQKLVAQRPEVAYGTTVLGVLATPAFVLSLQLGDGDILFVDEHGYTQRALSRHARHAGKRQSASLCQSAAAEEIWVQVEETTAAFPALILASTDGYVEGFTTDEEFLGLGEEYLKVLRSKGFDVVEERLKGFLGRVVYHGDGDDLTIGLVARR